MSKFNTTGARWLKSAKGIMSRERDEFISVLTRALPGVGMESVIGVARLLMRHGRTYCRIQEAICNGCPEQSSPTLPIDVINKAQARHDAYCEKREAQLERLLSRAAESVGLKVIFNGDPRGATVKVVLPNGASNSWGRDGWCVPGT